MKKKDMFTIKPVRNKEKDVQILTRFCHELAEFDGHKATFDVVKLQKNLFHPSTNVRAFLGYRFDEPMAFILAYECFTVYHGERGLYVPGAYVIPEYRHKGYGVKMFKFLTRYALENEFDFMNWIVEAGNEKANAIYKKMGAEISEGWSYVRLSHETLERISNV